MTQESQRIEKHSDEISFKETVIIIQKWWRYFFSKWVVILVFCFLGSALGFFYSMLKSPIYTATTNFVLEDQKGGGLGNLAGLASMAGVDLGGSSGGIFQGENILMLYRSRAMIEKTLLTTTIDNDAKNELLVDRYVDFNQLRKKWNNNKELESLRFLDDSLANKNQTAKHRRLRDSVLGDIVININKNILSVSKPDKKLSSIQIDVKAKDEVFAKAFNDGLVKIVNQFYINTKTKKALQNVEILQHKADSVRAVMNGAIYNAVAVSDATPNLNPTRQVQRVAPVQRSQFSAETNKAILSTIIQNLEMSKMALMKEAPLLEIVDKPIYPLKVDKLGKVKATLFGGILFGFFALVFLTSKSLIKDALV